MTQIIEQALAFAPPSQEALAKSFRLMDHYFDPQYLGLENIHPEKPTLLVGNHTRFGMLDIPLFIRGLYVERGVFARGLVDRLHYKIPVWRDLTGNNGGVLASREMCRALMLDGQTIMVFPGGAREVVKGRERNYQLLWRERLGFVRMAIEHGYSITPFSSVGADEALDVIFDGQDLMNSYLGKIIKRRGLEKYVRNGELLFPAPRGIGLSALPRPERFYFTIGKPIDTSSYAGQQDDKRVLQRLQRKTATAVNSLIKDTLLRRTNDKQKLPALRRILQGT